MRILPLLAWFGLIYVVAGEGENENFEDSTNSIAIIENKTACNNDTENYTCLAKTTDGNDIRKTIDPTVAPTIFAEERKVHVRMNKSATLTCNLNGYPLMDKNGTWIKMSPNDTELSMISSNISYSDNGSAKMILEFPNASDNDNGTYECRARYHNTTITSRCHLIVTDAPEVITANFVKSVGKGTVYLNWTINDHNEPLQNYSIERMEKGSEPWRIHDTVTDVRNSSHLLVGLNTEMEYKFRIVASNSVGKTSAVFNSSWVTVLKEDPDFVVRNVSIVEKSDNWITIAWAIPPANLRGYFQYYNIMMNHSQKEPEERYCPAEVTGIYNATNIDISEAVGYRFKVQACNNYTKQCCNWSDWSKPMTAISLSTSLKPSEISIIGSTIFSLYLLIGYGE